MRYDSRYYIGEITVYKSLLTQDFLIFIIVSHFHAIQSAGRILRFNTDIFKMPQHQHPHYSVLAHGFIFWGGTFMFRKWENVEACYDVVKPRNANVFGENRRANTFYSNYSNEIITSMYIGRGIMCWRKFIIRLKHIFFVLSRKSLDLTHTVKVNIIELVVDVIEIFE